MLCPRWFRAPEAQQPLCVAVAGGGAVRAVKSGAESLSEPACATAQAGRGIMEYDRLTFARRLILPSNPLDLDCSSPNDEPRGGGVEGLHSHSGSGSGSRRIDKTR
eukprot:COSAG06_NODE_48495_length_331_cov_1.603448_1_plen_105_part_01